MKSVQLWHDLPGKLKSALRLAEKVGEYSATRRMFKDFESGLLKASKSHLEDLAGVQELAEKKVSELERQILDGILAVVATVKVTKMSASTRKVGSMTRKKTKRT